jgi:hypothetical protein
VAQLYFQTLGCLFIPSYDLQDTVELFEPPPHPELWTKKERDRERERELGRRGVLRDTKMVGVKETIFSVLKVPRQCPLVLLVGARLALRINSKF